MGVHGKGLAGGDAEELGVEAGGVFEEASLPGVGGAGIVGVGVIEALDIPAAVGGELADAVAALAHQAPEPRGGGDPAGVAAGHADDRDRLLARGGAHGCLLERSARARLGKQVGGEGGGVGIVEDDRRPEAQAGGGAQPVAQLDRGEGVEAELLEGAVGVDLAGGGVAEDGGDLGADQLEDVGLALCLGHRGELCRQGAPGAALSGSAHEAAEDRRQGTGGGEGAQGPPVQGHRQGGGGSGGEGGVEEGEALLFGDRPDPATTQAHEVDLTEVASHSDSPLPGSPGDRGGREAFRAALLGQGVEEDVGGGVVGLARAAEGARRGGEEDEGVEVCLPGQLVQVPSGVCLGGKDALQLLGDKGLDRGLNVRPGAVKDRAQGVGLGDPGEGLSEGIGVRCVTSRDLCLDSQCLQVCLQLLCPLGLGAGATEQEQPAGAVVLCEVSGE